MRFFNKETITGGGALALDGIDPLDVFGDSTNRVLEAGDLCFVIDPSGGGTIHKAVYLARYDFSGHTSTTLPTTNPTGWCWIQLVSGDLDFASPDQATIQLPASDTPPAGYSEIADTGHVIGWREYPGNSGYAGKWFRWNGALYHIVHNDLRAYEEDYLNSVVLYEHTSESYYSSAILVGDELFVMGWNSVTPTATSVWKYNMDTGVATDLTGHPQGSLRELALASDGTDIYVIGGEDEVSGVHNYFYSYSISGDTWTALTNAPFSASNVGLVVDNSGYVWAMDDSTGPALHRFEAGVGWTSGYTLPYSFSNWPNNISPFIHDPVTDTIWYFLSPAAWYDPGTDTWTTVAGYSDTINGYRTLVYYYNDRMYVLWYYHGQEFIFSGELTKLYSNIP